MDGERRMAMFIAMVVRNAMEDFHVAFLSDAHMAKLNPIVRNAVYTALHAVKAASTSPGARAYVRRQEEMIPEYWEPPVLLDDYVAAERIPHLDAARPRRPGASKRSRRPS